MPDTLLAMLLDLAVPHEDVAAVLSTVIPPELAATFEAHVRQLTETVGTVTELPRWELPPGAPAFYFVHVFAAALPHVQRYHQQRDIPQELSRLILTDLGRQLAVHRRRTGTAGMDTHNWITRHFQGRIYQLGRLQFEQMTLLGSVAASMAAAGLPYREGDPVLSIHIPEYCGPFTPTAVDAALAQARPFFARHFPEIRYEIGVCESWMLDPQLTEHLSPDSNILAFARRFVLSHTTPGDSIQRFVAGGSRLHRAVAAGGTWHTGSGYLLLPS
ncbi:hypothetical protein F4553_000862 [Allocatelliglobosispora scoriae]|uniref:Acyltransferase n=1 Tax=Allocatelliglobosispora scoriae TaxID=643052 RepID=A0A841BKF3_9ACTN|nr:acyltransferase domain-containing protein [Allocatelliglobosispora scoriae]MBB5867483.1 hypothetical protein [Allocatelliglobosispora scoriae]